MVKDRLFDYMRAVETGTSDKYHDYQDVKKGRMTIDEYNRKHGRFTGSGGMRKHD